MILLTMTPPLGLSIFRTNRFSHVAYLQPRIQGTSLHSVDKIIAMSAAPIPWKHIRNVLVLFAPLWVGATIVFGLMGSCYALFSADKYSARQPLIVRDQANGSVLRLGRFASMTDLKAAQETVLEMTQSHEVVRNALQQIGPVDGEDPTEWPSTTVVEGTIKSSVNLVAPKGSDFGNTEVVYLEVKAEDKARTVEFSRAMYDSLTEHLRKVRRVRADSVIMELQFARDMAQQNLDEVASRMQEIEATFGADLGDLRNLNDSISGDGAGRRGLTDATKELDDAETELTRLKSLYQLLVTGAENPQHMLVSGSDLLSDQPSLQRLKDGLIDAQLRSSELSGIYTMENPKRKAALSAEGEIRERMKQEIVAVIQAMQPRIALEEKRIASLEAKREAISVRLEKIAVARTNYAKIDDELDHRTTLLEEADRALTEAQASRTAALSTNLVEELGPAQVTDKPIGPSGSLVAVGASMAGLIFGLGAVFLIAPGPTESHGRRRWSDYLSGQGRRASDEGALDNRRAESTKTPESGGDNRRS